MLGSYPTNSRQIEPQIMKKFFQQQQVQSVQMPQECSSLSQALLNDSRWTRSLLQSVSVSSMCALQVQISVILEHVIIRSLHKLQSM